MTESDKVRERLEHYNDKVRLDLAEREVILRDAIEILRDTTRLDRNGNPEDSFGLIAGLWGQYLAAQNKINVTLTRQDVCILMALLKIARISTRGDTDSFTDAAAYISLAWSNTSKGKTDD